MYGDWPSRDEQAVSPVIGVVLMVAVTVVLAAVTAAFVFGVGDRIRTTAPQADFSFDYRAGSTGGTDDLNNSGDFDGTLTITHAGGATVEAGALGVVGHTSGDGEQRWDTSVYGSDEAISAGEGLDVYVNETDTVLVTWSDDSGSNSATLGRWHGPDA